LNAAKSAESTPIGVIGLGAMGWGLATRIMEVANLVAVHDQSAEVASKAQEFSLPYVASVSEVAGKASVVICMLPSPDIFVEVVTGVGGLAETMRPGGVVIDMATDGPGPVTSVREALAAGGISVLDAAVGRGPREAASGDLIIMAGGEAEKVESLRWLYELLGSEVHHCGPLGSGQAAKLVNNLVQCANAAILAEACALARATGVSDDAIRGILPGTAAASRQLESIVLTRLPARDFVPGFKVALAAKDVRLAVLAGESCGLTMPCSAEVLKLYERYIGDGFGGLDQAVIAAPPEIAAAAKEAPLA